MKYMAVPTIVFADIILVVAGSPAHQALDPGSVLGNPICVNQSPASFASRAGYILPVR